MNRSGYSFDLDNWTLVRWRGAVASAIRGKRGQAALRELLAALDAMPEKVLASGVLVDEHGDYCALGVLGAARGLDLSVPDPDDPWSVAEYFSLPRALVAEIEFENDDGDGWRGRETPDVRWARMRAWVVEHIAKEQEK